MANAIFDIARKKFALNELKWDATPFAGATMVAMLYDTTPADGQGSTVNMSTLLTTAESLTGFDLSNLTVNNSGGHLRGKTTMTGLTVETNGACNAPQVTFSSVTSTPGNSATGILIVAVDASNDPADCIPVVWIDSATGLPITPNGGNIIVTWDTGVNKIFRL